MDGCFFCRPRDLCVWSALESLSFLSSNSYNHSYTCSHWARGQLVIHADVCPPLSLFFSGRIFGALASRGTAMIFAEAWPTSCG